ncbi:ribokinase [Streptomyces sp. SceaMP-e96]|uniref:Ribokinase n=1 Tax=Streptomyces nigrescens TaxID=1920 RepID=A0A640TP58_STRNI|nr:MULTISPECIES: ribokinase [Streptomyces]MCW7984125.1 ribokinase [Streptomyces platensis subsp. clarensis]MYT12722.1 ribokinase [Streptomyces sp. SID4951]WAT99202.1 ribokinase [Streptomyces libani subsp. libani]SCK38212.1 ribokinase [Streptomyces sp. SceaMP-e96]GFE24910.1 ribokinase [Streptomyces libani subsp. libani]
MYDVLVVGSANADLTVRVDRRPGAGETVLGTDLVESAGGKGANQAAAAARIGGRTALLARVGGDAYGELLLGAQRAAGTDVTPVIVDGTARTGTAMIIVDPDGDNSIVVSPGANAALTPQDVAAAKDTIAASAVVSLQLEIPMESVRAAASAAEQAGTRVVLNPSPAPTADLAPELLSVADPLVVNEHEARQLSGLTDGTPAQWAQALRDRGARSVVVTLGGDGALVLDADGAENVPGVRVKAVDTTGAGDAFTGALATRLARGDALPEAARFAVRVGAAAVTKPGAQPSYPTRAELEVLAPEQPQG